MTQTVFRDEKNVLTKNWQNDNNKVKNIPWFFKIPLSKREYFQNAFGGENDNESEVEVVQGETPHAILVIVIKCHGEHVDTNEAHDDHIELLVGHDPEHDGLRFPLKGHFYNIYI